MRLFPRATASPTERRTTLLTQGFTLPLARKMPPRTAAGHVCQVATPSILAVVVAAGQTTEPQ